MSSSWAKGSDYRWRRFRVTILERDKYTCQIAGPKCTTAATQVDHITPLSLGGVKYDPANCRASCAPCNLGRRVVPTHEPPPKQVSSW